MANEETHRAKRPRHDGLQSPSLTDGRSGIDLQSAPSLSTKSSYSSQPTDSRDSSPSKTPSKRHRNLAIKFSGPTLHPLDRDEAKEWITSHEAPLLKDLIQCIEDQQESPRDDHLSGIHEEVKRCLRRNANEDSWSDFVVLPFLQLARKLSNWLLYVDIINVKSIDITPTLLSGPYKKRVDYSLGLEVADTATSLGIQRTLEDYTMSQSNHYLLNDRALFSHLEIKAESDTATAESQLKVWCAAGFRKQVSIYREARDGGSTAPVLAPQPLWIWEKDKVQLSIAVMDLTEDKIYFLSQKTFLIDSEESLRPLLGVMVKIIDWGYTQYLPWFRELIGRADLNNKNS